MAQRDGRRAPEAAEEVARLLEEIDDPEHSRTSMDRLHALGFSAVPFLIEAIESDRREVAQKAAEILRFLGPTRADAAGPRLRRLAESDDAELAHLAQWALVAFPHRQEIVVAEYESGRILCFGPDSHEADFPERDLPPGEARRTPVAPVELALGLEHAWDAEPLPGGNLLVAQFGPRRIWERTPAGEEVWLAPDSRRALDADRLVNGNTLIADSRSKSVVEIDRAGKVVWSHETGGQLYNVERLPNGHTLLVVFPGEVLEVDRAGETVWKLTGLEGVFDADRLPNGHTLLTLYNGGAVRIVDRDGETVSEITGLSHPNDAELLPDGNVLVVAAHHVTEYAFETGKPLRRWVAAARLGKLYRR